MPDRRSYPASGTLHLAGWFGRLDLDVEILNETPKRYRVRSKEYIHIGARKFDPGAVVMVPKDAVTVRGS